MRQSVYLALIGAASAIRISQTSQVPAPGPPPMDSHPLPATTELPSADPKPRRMPTRTPLEPRDHATTPRLSPPEPAPGPPLVDSHLMPTRTPLEPRDHATTP